MKIETKLISELFYLYCALNYNGYDKENSPEGMHRVRQLVREELSKRNLPKYNFQYHPYQYTKQILTSKNLKSTKNTNSDFVKFLSYIKDFSEKARLDGLWKTTVKKETETELAHYQLSIKNIQGLLKNSFDFKPKLEKIIFTVNLLESYWRGFAIKIGEIAYVITGPSEKPNTRNLLHELAHLYLEDLHFNLTPKILEKIQLIPQHLRKNYREDENIMKESMIRALVVNLSGKQGKGIKKEEFSDSDKSLLLTMDYYKFLQEKGHAKFSKEMLTKIGEFSVN